MTTAPIAFVAFLVASILVGLVRVLLGPTPGDRMLAPQLVGTAGIAALLTAADAFGAPSLRDVALLLALLAVVTTAAFALRAWRAPPGDRP